MSFKELVAIFNLNLSLLYLFLCSLYWVNTGDIISEIIECDFFYSFVLLWTVLKCSSESCRKYVEKIFINFFGVFGIFFVLNMIDEKLKIIQEKILIVRRWVKIVFQYFFWELNISEVLDDKLSILDNNIGNDVNIGSKDSQYSFI